MESLQQDPQHPGWVKGWMVLREKQEAEPPAPLDLNAETPEDLDALCRDLLRRDPERRPRGAEILRRLKGGPGSGFAAPPPAPRAPVAFVGRKQELAALWESFRVVKQGATMTVSVQGGSAIGS